MRITAKIYQVAFLILFMMIVSPIIFATPDRCIIAIRVRGVFGKPHLALFTASCSFNNHKFKLIVRRHRMHGEPVIWVKCAHDQCARARQLIFRYVRVNRHLPLHWSGKVIP